MYKMLRPPLRVQWLWKYVHKFDSQINRAMMITVHFIQKRLSFVGKLVTHKVLHGFPLGINISSISKPLTV